MTFFPLSNEDKSHLKRLNEDKATIFALKKLFMNACIEKPNAYDVQTLAAERAAIEYIKKSFHDLNIIKPDNILNTKEENLV